MLQMLTREFDSWLFAQKEPDWHPLPCLPLGGFTCFCSTRTGSVVPWRVPLLCLCIQCAAACVDTSPCGRGAVCSAEASRVRTRPGCRVSASLRARGAGVSEGARERKGVGGVERLVRSHYKKVCQAGVRPQTIEVASPLLTLFVRHWLTHCKRCLCCCVCWESCSAPWQVLLRCCPRRTLTRRRWVASPLR